MNTLDKMTALEMEAADFGFKWETAAQIKEQILSELKEVEVHLHDNDKVKLQEEIGDLLHAVLSLTIFCDLDPQQTLQNAVDKFEKRFTSVKKLAYEKGLTDLNGKSFDELMALWDLAKLQK